MSVPDASTGYGPPPLPPRPGTVTLAAALTITLSSLLLVLFVLVGVGIAVDRELFVGERDGGIAGSTSLSSDQLALAGIIATAVFALWCAAAIGLAVGVLRGSRVARILLTVSASLTALVSMLAVASVISIVPMGFAVGVVVLLWTGAAGEWFAARGRPVLPG